jgi:hypothetical protein
MIISLLKYAPQVRGALLPVCHVLRAFDVGVLELAQEVNRRLVDCWCADGHVGRIFELLPDVFDVILH